MAQRYDDSLSTTAQPSATEQQLRTERSPLTMIVLAVIIASGCMMLVGFLVRISKMDGDLNAAVQWGIGGMLVPWVLCGAGCVLLILREFVYLFEVTTKRDITGDGQIGRSPVVALNPYTGRANLAADNHAAQLSQWSSFVHGCESHTSWASWRDTINRETWQDWRDELMASGWAVKDYPDQQNSPWRLTASASTILAAVTTPSELPSRTRA